MYVTRDAPINTNLIANLFLAQGTTLDTHHISQGCLLLEDLPAYFHPFTLSLDDLLFLVHPNDSQYVFHFLHLI